MHVGKSEGAQIIQPLGRGVRLKGHDWSLQRSGFVEPHGLQDEGPGHKKIEFHQVIKGIQARLACENVILNRFIVSRDLKILRPKLTKTVRRPMRTKKMRLSSIRSRRQRQLCHTMLTTSCARAVFWSAGRSTACWSA